MSQHKNFENLIYHKFLCHDMSYVAYVVQHYYKTILTVQGADEKVWKKRLWQT